MENVTNTLQIILSKFPTTFIYFILFRLTFFILLRFFLLLLFLSPPPLPFLKTTFSSAVGYGGIDKGGFNDAIPPAYWQYAYQFAG